MQAAQRGQTRLRDGGDPCRRRWYSPSDGSGKSSRCSSCITSVARLTYHLTQSLLALKSIMGLNLLAFAHGRQSGMDQREQEDRINDFGRKPIGDSLQEQVWLDARPSRVMRPDR